MAVRARATVIQNASNVVLRWHVGEDGALPSGAPSQEIEFPNMAALQSHLEQFEADFEGGVSGMVNFGLLQLLREAQGNVVALAGQTVSTVLDKDPGQFGIRVVKGS